jgi:hypothetical protein
VSLAVTGSPLLRNDESAQNRFYLLFISFLCCRKINTQAARIIQSKPNKVMISHDLGGISGIVPGGDVSDGVAV